MVIDNDTAEGAVPVICVYDIGNEDYEKNGDAVLMPTKGSIRMVATPYA